MDLNPKKYIDFIDQTLNLDPESKNKTTWIVIKILNILMTIELAVFIADRFGYSITIDKIDFDAFLLAFKHYDIIVGVSCFILAYFGTREVSWFLPNAISYTRYWNNWSINTSFKEKMNKLLDDPNEFESWRGNHERRFNDAKIYTERFKLSLLFCGNIFLTYHFIVRTSLPAFYSEVVDVLSFMAMVVAAGIYTIYKDDLLFSLSMADYFDYKKKFEIMPVRKIDRYALKVLHWVANTVTIGTILIVIGFAFTSKS